MTTHADVAARAWVETWSRAWPAADVEAICALYAPNARFHSQSFRDHERPQSYVERVFAEQARAECRFGAPIVSGDRAAVDWWGVIEDHDGGVETIAGTSLLRFAPDGKVLEQRDAWGSATGRVDLPYWASARCPSQLSRLRAFGRPRGRRYHRQPCAATTSRRSAAR